MNHFLQKERKDLKLNQFNYNHRRLQSYCNKWKLKINTTKTVYTIFSKSQNEANKNLNIRIGEKAILKESNPTYLCVQLNGRFTLTKHVENLKQNATKRLKIVKRLASSKWGADKANLRQITLAM